MVEKTEFLKTAVLFSLGSDPLRSKFLIERDSSNIDQKLLRVRIVEQI